MKITTTLVIGDSHAEPGKDNSRFDALGNFIVDRRPDNITQMGDFLTMDSFGTHDLPGSLAREGRRMKDDIDAGADAYKRMMKPLVDLRNSQAKGKRKQYAPNGIWLLGNHEDRATRYMQARPELEGFIDANSLLPVGKDGWTVVPYRSYHYLEGVAFTHVPMNPKNNQPISGKYVTARAAEIHSQPVVFAHTHMFQVHTIARNSEVQFGDQVRAINCGWFADFQPDYITNRGARDWWSGLTVLHHFGEGKFDIETISMERLKEEYL